MIYIDATKIAECCPVTAVAATPFGMEQWNRFWAGIHAGVVPTVHSWKEPPRWSHQSVWLRYFCDHCQERMLGFSRKEVR